MRSAIAVALIIVGWTTSAVHADTSIGVVVAGDGARITEVSLELKGWLERRGNVVVSTPLPSEAIPRLGDCFVVGDLGCARTIVDAEARASAVLYAVVDAERGSSDVQLTFRWFTKGQRVASATSTCSQCTMAQLRLSVDALIRKLAGTVLGTGDLKIRSTPSARITIDGISEGTTPSDLELPAGRYAVDLALDGHQPERHVAVVRPNKTTLVDASARADSTAERDRPWWRSRSFALIAMTAGTASLVAGGVEIAIDQRQIGPAPKQVYDTWIFGVPLTVVGIAAIGVGAYTWARPSDVRATPVISVSPRAAYVGWVAQF